MLSWPGPKYLNSCVLREKPPLDTILIRSIHVLVSNAKTFEGTKGVPADAPFPYGEVCYIKTREESVGDIQFDSCSVKEEHPVTFEEASFKAREFAVMQGFSSIFLELEGGELHNGQWQMHFIQTLYPKKTHIDVMVDNQTQQVVGLKRLE